MKRCLIETDSFPFEFISEIAELESWRKEVYRPIYHLHKWWAKRLGSVFRGILLGSVLSDSEDLGKAFYQKQQFRRVKVFDPFMGSGTTIGEAHKLGMIALGRDINPIACESVRVSLGPLERRKLKVAIESLSSGVGERIRDLYKTKDSAGNVCDTLYFFWVKHVPCAHCSKPVDLFPSYIFAKNAYPKKKPEVQVVCPGCGSIFEANINDQEVSCPGCKIGFNPHAGPAERASANCRHCKKAFSIAEAVRSAGIPPAHRLYAKLILTDSGEKVYLRTTTSDIAAYNNCTKELSRQKLPLPTLKIKPGYNTDQVRNYGYSEWSEFFNDRQSLALGLLHKAILEIPDAIVRDAVLTVFSGALEFNNMFASYKGEGTGAIRHMFAHHILKPERMPIEGNVWGTNKSSGSFSTLFKLRLERALDYRDEPFEVGIDEVGGGTVANKVFRASDPFTGIVSTQWPPGSEMQPRSIHLSCGSSQRTELDEGSIDLVVTDPPFFDNVHYSELADFFQAWRQPNLSPFKHKRGSTRNDDEVQDGDAQSFAEKLRDVFSECNRILKPDGLLVFTYHHSRTEGWTSLAEAVTKAGFSIVNAHPVKAEMSGATPKAQAKEPIQIDMIIVCQRQVSDYRKRVECDVAFSNALNRSRLKEERLIAKRFDLSKNDRRVILISQFLSEISAKRSFEEVKIDLSKAMDNMNMEIENDPLIPLQIPETKIAVVV